MRRNGGKGGTIDTSPVVMVFPKKSVNPDLYPAANAVGKKGGQIDGEEVIVTGLSIAYPFHHEGMIIGLIEID